MRNVQRSGLNSPSNAGCSSLVARLCNFWEPALAYWYSYIASNHVLKSIWCKELLDGRRGRIFEESLLLIRGRKSPLPTQYDLVNVKAAKTTELDALAPAMWMQRSWGVVGTACALSVYWRPQP
jgi:hypothetical protein